MRLKDWNDQEKPREKLLLKGAAALSDAELLAIILRTGLKGESVVDFARRVLNEVSDFRTLFHLDLHTLQSIRGMSQIRYIELQAIREIHQRYHNEFIQRKDLLRNSKQTSDFLLSKLRDQPKEIFSCIFLNSQNYMIAYEELISGSLMSAYVYPRELIKRILHHNAASIILAHNHPSGDCKPSYEDQLMTQKMMKATEIIQVQLIDHFIIGENQIFSFAEHGWVFYEEI